MDSNSSAGCGMDDILSTPDGETAFFRSIIRYRPRGQNRHFSMVGMCKDLERELQTVIPSEKIWSNLRSCYNLDILSEMEPDDPDEIERSRSTLEILNSKKSTFQEFQLPIDSTLPAGFSFLELINERRLETSNPSSPGSPSSTASPRRRTTFNSSSKYHVDRLTTHKHSNKHHPTDSSTSKTLESTSPQEGMESDLTEPEDYDEDDEEEREEVDKEEEDEEVESTPELKGKKARTSKSQHESISSTTTSRSRSTNNALKSIPSTSTRSNRSSRAARSRWKK